MNALERLVEQVRAEHALSLTPRGRRSKRRKPQTAIIAELAAEKAAEHSTAEAVQVGTFFCKRCKVEHDTSVEVVTRYRTRVCKQAWGRQVAIGRRTDSGLSPDVCIKCGVNPRRSGHSGVGHGWCESCTQADKRNRRKSERRSGKQLVKRETHECIPEVSST